MKEYWWKQEKQAHFEEHYDLYFLLFYVKMVRNHSQRSLSKMLSLSGSLDFCDAEWWNASTRWKYATQNKKPLRACSSYINDTYEYIIRTFLLSANTSAFQGCNLDIAFNTLLMAPTFVMPREPLLGGARPLSVAVGWEFVLWWRTCTKM